MGKHNLEGLGFERERLERYAKEDRRRKLEENVEKGLWASFIGSAGCYLIFATMMIPILLFLLCLGLGIMPLALWEFIQQLNYF